MKIFDRTRCLPLRRKPYFFLTKRQQLRVQRSIRTLIKDARESSDRSTHQTISNSVQRESTNFEIDATSSAATRQNNVSHHGEIGQTEGECINPIEQRGPLPAVASISKNNFEFENAKFQNNLASAVLATRMSHTQIDRILRVLRTHQCLRFLPKRARTLIGTPRDAEEVEEIPPGEYLHIGLENALNNLLDKSNLQRIPDELHLDIHTDGGRLDKKTCFWPILCKIDNVDKRKVGVIGIYKGKKKPGSATHFFNAFIQEALEIEENDGIDYRDRKIKIKFRCFIADAPARAFLLCHKSHNSKKPCSKCKVEGTTYVCKNKQKITHHTVYLGSSHERRTTEEYHDRLDEEHHFPEQSPLIHILTSLVESVPFEYMHSVLLGVVPKLLSVWLLGTYNKSARLSLQNRKDAAQRFLLISKCCPEEYARKPSDLFEFESFKATEYRQIILVTGILVFRGLLPKSLYYHFLILHTAIRCLCFYADSDMHVHFAELALKKFVHRAPELYSDAFMSYNVHSLLHLVEDSRKHGNLDRFAAFVFENVMGMITKFLRKPSAPLQQIRNRLIELNKHSENDGSIDENTIYPSKEHHEENLLPQYQQFKKLKFNEITLRNQAPNNCIFVNNRIHNVQNIVKCENSYILVAKQFASQRALYNVGISSVDVGVFQVSDLQETTTFVPVNNNVKKCFLIPGSILSTEFESCSSSEEFVQDDFVACIM